MVGLNEIERPNRVQCKAVLSRSGAQQHPAVIVILLKLIFGPVCGDDAMFREAHNGRVARTKTGIRQPVRTIDLDDVEGVGSRRSFGECDRGGLTIRAPRLDGRQIPMTSRRQEKECCAQNNIRHVYWRQVFQKSHPVRVKSICRGEGRGSQTECCCGGRAESGSANRGWAQRRLRMLTRRRCGSDRRIIRLSSCLHPKTGRILAFDSAILESVAESDDFGRGARPGP